jgi:hypothetical protein
VMNVDLGGCGREDAPSRQDTPTVIAAGDITSCASEGDEGTADLLSSIDATVLNLSDRLPSGHG